MLDNKTIDKTVKRETCEVRMNGILKNDRVLSRIEPLGNYTYRQCVNCYGDDVLRQKAISMGLTPLSDTKDVYVSEPFKIDDNDFAFGLSLYECFNRFTQDRECFRTLAISANSEFVGAEAGKEIGDKNLSGDIVLKTIEHIGVEQLLYMSAANYSEQLVKEAEDKYAHTGTGDFLQWFKDNVVIKTEQEMQECTLLPSHVDPFQDDILIAWQEVHKNIEDYKRWSELYEKEQAHTLLNVFLTCDLRNRYFILYKFCFEGELCQKLFAVLNSSKVAHKTKKRILSVLSEKSTSDMLFANKLQVLYNEYLMVEGTGRKINFLDISFTAPTAEIRKTDTYQEINRKYKPRMEQVFNWLVKNDYLDEESHSLFLYRFQCVPSMAYQTTNQIVWKGTKKELTGFIAHISTDTRRFVKTEGFFKVRDKQGNIVEYKNSGASRDAQSSLEANNFVEKLEGSFPDEDC